MLQAKVAFVFVILALVLPGMIAIATFDSFDLALKWRDRPRKR